jgi:hypothetical protein
VTRDAFPAGLQFLQKLLSMLKGLTCRSDLRFGFVELPMSIDMLHAEKGGGAFNCAVALFEAGGKR